MHSEIYMSVKPVFMAKKLRGRYEKPVAMTATPLLCEPSSNDPVPGFLQTRTHCEMYYYNDMSDAEALMRLDIHPPEQ